METKEYTYELISNISGVDIIDEPQNTNGISNIIKLIGVTYNKVSKLSKETEIKFENYDTFIEGESNKISALENSKVSFVVQDGKVTFTQKNTPNNITAEVFTTEIYDENLSNIHNRYNNIKNILFGNDNIEVENYPKKNIINTLENGIEELNTKNNSTNDRIDNLIGIFFSKENFETYDTKTNIIGSIHDRLDTIDNDILTIEELENNIDKNQKFLQGREDYYKCCALLGVDDIVYNTNNQLDLKNNESWLENGRDKNILFRKGKKYYQIEHNRDYNNPYCYYWCIINNKDTCFNPTKTEFKKYDIGNDKYREVTYYYNINSLNKTKFISDIPQISLNFFIKEEFVKNTDLDNTIINCIPNIEYFTTSNSNNTNIKKFPNVKYKENNINYIISTEKENIETISNITYKPKKLYDIEPTYNIIPSLESITLFYKNNQLINLHDFRFFITIYKNNKLCDYKYNNDLINSFKVGDSAGNEELNNNKYFHLLLNEERVNFYSFQNTILNKTYITYEVKIDEKVFKKTILINKIELKN